MKRSSILFTFVFALASTTLFAQAEDCLSETQRAWFEVGGRAHVAIVHFPIALILAAFFLEVWAMLRKRAVSPSGITCLNLGWLGGIATVASGWYLARFYTGDIETADPIAWLSDIPEDDLDRDLFIHAWTGLGATVLGMILAIFGSMARRRDQASVIYRLGLLIASLLVAWAGHMGGEMVHGEDFLVEPLQQLEAEKDADASSDEVSIGVGDSEADSDIIGSNEDETTDDPVDAPDGNGEAEGAPRDQENGRETGAAEPKRLVTPPVDAPSAAEDPDEEIAQRVSFQRDIAPIFERSCHKCHGEKRGKGGLRMHERSELFPTDIEDWAVIPGKPDESLILERMLLDPSSRKFMPKKGDPLPEEEISLIKRWIEQGAVWDEAPADDDAGDKEQAAAASAPINLDAKRERLAGIETLVSTLRASGAAATPLARGDERLDLNFSVLRDRFVPTDLDAIRGFEEQVVELNLAATGADDALLERIASFTNLERLHLEKTAVTDAGMKHLAGLKKLRYLNLYGTKVSDAGLGSLEELSALRKLYLWGSEVTRPGAEGLEKAVPGLRVDLGDSLLPTPTPVAEPKGDPKKD